jgi:hypothetical protein
LRRSFSDFKALGGGLTASRLEGVEVVGESLARYHVGAKPCP